MPDADASGISQSPDEIDFIDVNGDGKADYVWTRPIDGSVRVWYNDYPNKPTWLEAGKIAVGVGTSGANIRYGKLLSTGREDYVAVDRKTGAIGAWLNGCGDLDTSKKKHRITIIRVKASWSVYEKPTDASQPKTYCDPNGESYARGSQEIADQPEDAEYPSAVVNIQKLYDHDCFYVGGFYRVGKLICDGISGIRCYKDEKHGETQKCRSWSYEPSLYCEW